MKNIILPVIVICAFLVSGCDYEFTGELIFSDIDYSTKNPEEPSFINGQFLIEVNSDDNKTKKNVIKLLSGIFYDMEFIGFEDRDFDTLAKIKVKIPLLTNVNDKRMGQSLFSLLIDSKNSILFLVTSPDKVEILNNRLEEELSSLDISSGTFKIKIMNDLRKDLSITIKESVFVNNKPHLPTIHGTNLPIESRDSIELKLGNVSMHYLESKNNTPIFRY